MLLGTPVIAANSGGNPEAIDDGKTGMLVPADDADAFARACLKLFQDSAYQKSIIELARSETRRRFSIARHVNAITAIYESFG